MINVQFFTHNSKELLGVSVQGHAMYGEYGEDIVCASVTSALQLTINGITEILGVKANVLVEENKIQLRVLNEADYQKAGAFLKSLELHLNILKETYPDTIQLTFWEVT